jgi:hypothetical protein
MMEAKTFQWHCGMQSIPHHGSNEKGESLLDLKVGHKYNESTQKLNLGSPT